MFYVMRTKTLHEFGRACVRFREILSLTLVVLFPFGSGRKNCDVEMNKYEYVVSVLNGSMNRMCLCTHREAYEMCIW